MQYKLKDDQSVENIKRRGTSCNVGGMLGINAADPYAGVARDDGVSVLLRAATDPTVVHCPPRQMNR
jgi:hypothetical protein